jgi:ATP-dependent Clp protease ATP-binding subunit ClpX
MQSSEQSQLCQRGILMKPSDMLSALDPHIFGQSYAKRAVCSAVYNHYLSLASRDENGLDLGRNHILLLGPTGSGKTMLVKLLASMLNVPFVQTCASTLVESGYRGRPVEDVIRSLLEQTQGNPRQAERGIIFIDEIDKIRRQDVGGGRDVSGEGVQNALLTLLEGRICDVIDNTRIPAVDTSRILFICAGAFAGLQEIVRRRLQHGQGRIGFQTSISGASRRASDLDEHECMCQATVEDLDAYGMIPEFIGRFARIAVLQELTKEDLHAILRQPSCFSSLYQRQQVARLHGISLEVTDDALEALAERAKAMKTGARAIARLLGDALDRVEYRWPELADDRVSRVILDRRSVLAGAEPKLVRARREIHRRDSALRKRFLASEPVSAKKNQRAPEKAKPGGQVPGWSSASKEARAFWEILERTYAGNQSVLEQTVSKLTSISAGLDEFHAMALATEDRNPEEIIAHLIRKRLRELVDGSEQTDDSEWPVDESLYNPDFENEEFVDELLF